MKYFVTGASGWVGTAVTTQLLAAGHQVLGLARSDASADKLKALGAEVLRGDLTDIDALKHGASTCDGVAHLGFIHDFSNFEQCCLTDREAILAMSSVMHGTHKPLVASFGILFLPNDKTATEDTFADISGGGAVTARAQTERILLDQAQYGVDTMSIRLSPTTHGNGDQGMMAMFIAAARKNGRSAYVGEGTNVWTACYRDDTAHLFVLALQKPIAGKVLHAVHDQGVPWKDFATTIGDQLGLPTVSITPEQASDHFGFLGHFVTANSPASSDLTQQRLGWKPTGPSLIEDLKQGHYFTDTRAGKYTV